MPSVSLGSGQNHLRQRVVVRMTLSLPKIRAYAMKQFHPLT